MIKKYLPRKILWRIFFIFIVPFIILQTIIGIVFYQQYLQTQLEFSLRQIDLHISHSVYHLKKQKTPTEKQAYLALLSQKSKQTHSLEHKNKKVTNCQLSREMRFVKRYLKTHYPDYKLCKNKFDDEYHIYAPFDGDYHFVLTVRKKDFFYSQWHFLPVWSLGSSIILIMIAFIFLKNQVRPIVRLGKAAEAFGKGDHNFPIHPSGAIEIHKASEAFIEMRQNIAEHLQNRAMLLAGISHDLRTILTRFSLEVSLLDTKDDLSPIKSDIKNMQDILKSYLDFIAHNHQRKIISLDIEATIQNIIDTHQNTSIDIAYTHQGKTHISLYDQALERCLLNIISNNVRFANKILIHSSATSQQIDITIEDNGPGISPENQKRIFEPFFSMKEKNDSSISGLGLSITKDIVKHHGGFIEASSSEILGGLKIILNLKNKNI